MLRAPNLEVNEMGWGVMWVVLVGGGGGWELWGTTDLPPTLRSLTVSLKNVACPPSLDVNEISVRNLVRRVSFFFA